MVVEKRDDIGFATKGDVTVAETADTTPSIDAQTRPGLHTMDPDLRASFERVWAKAESGLRYLANR